MAPEDGRRFLVAQLGARMHYAVPRILHAAGLLERLYTDIVAPGSAVTSALARLARNDSLRRLMARTPDGIPRRKIVHFPGFGFQCLLRQRAARSAAELTAAFLWAGTEFCRRITRRGTGSATAVYTFNSAGLELLEFAKARGLFTALEQVLAPWAVVRSFVQQESEAWPDWESQDSRDELAEEFSARERQEWETSDCILCPSEFVVEAVRAAGGPVERCRVVPYGVDLALAPQHERPDEKLHVLFCGSVDLRKGVPYLWQAASLLPPARFWFRLAGPVRVSDNPRKQLAARMELLGPVPRPEMPTHYRWADVFVLPTLCEGSATVCYEALASGLPVITTPNAGSVVRDGVEGFIVPIRDGEAIAEKLELLAAQPELLAEMSRNALARAREFTLERYGERLLAALAREPLCSHDEPNSHPVLAG